MPYESAGKRPLFNANNASSHALSNAIDVFARRADIAASPQGDVDKYHQADASFKKRLEQEISIRTLYQEAILALTPEHLENVLCLSDELKEKVRREGVVARFLELICQKEDAIDAKSIRNQFEVTETRGVRYKTDVCDNTWGGDFTLIILNNYATLFDDTRKISYRFE